MTHVYKIKSDILRLKGERIEGVDRSRIEARLEQVKRHTDPEARLVAIPIGGR